MAIKNKITYSSGKEIVHFIGVFQSDYSLCGQDLAGDTMGEFGSYHTGVATKEKVNCPQCIEIVEYVKKIKKTEYIIEKQKKQWNHKKEL